MEKNKNETNIEKPTNGVVEDENIQKENTSPEQKKENTPSEQKKENTTTEQKKDEKSKKKPRFQLELKFKELVEHCTYEDLWNIIKDKELKNKFSKNEILYIIENYLYKKFDFYKVIHNLENEELRFGVLYNDEVVDNIITFNQVNALPNSTLNDEYIREKLINAFDKDVIMATYTNLILLTDTFFAFILCSYESMEHFVFMLSDNIPELVEYYDETLKHEIGHFIHHLEIIKENNNDKIKGIEEFHRLHDEQNHQIDEFDRAFPNHTSDDWSAFYSNLILERLADKYGGVNHDRYIELENLYINKAYLK